MNQREQPSAIDRKKQDFARWAEIRERLDMTRTARQEAIADFILSMTAMAKQLREALDIRATGFDARAMPNLDPFLDELMFRIRLHFRETFGRELFDCPPADEQTSAQYGPPPFLEVAQTVQQLTEHEVAMLKAAKDAMTFPSVPGWPVVIYTQTADDSALGIVNRTTALNMPADIARPATAESITPPPTDGGE